MRSANITTGLSSFLGIYLGNNEEESNAHQKNCHDSRRGCEAEDSTEPSLVEWCYFSYELFFIPQLVTLFDLKAKSQAPVDIPSLDQASSLHYQKALTVS